MFHYFAIFAFICVHSQPTKIMFVDTKYKNGKQILLLTDFASYNLISEPFNPIRPRGGSISSPPSLFLKFCYEAVKPQ